MYNTDILRPNYILQPGSTNLGNAKNLRAYVIATPPSYRFAAKRTFEKIRMNSGAGSRLLNISRCLRQQQLEQAVSSSGAKSFSRFASTRVFSRQFCESCFEQTCVGVTCLRGPGQSDRTSQDARFLGANRGQVSKRQERYYSRSRKEGRRWIMKQHFKGMPTFQVMITPTRHHQWKMYVFLCRTLTLSQSLCLNWRRGRYWSSDFRLICNFKNFTKQIIFIVIRPEFWSVDPYARIYPISFGFKLPMTMLGSQVFMMIIMIIHDDHDDHSHANCQSALL